jgi:hypothetical protein
MRWLQVLLCIVLFLSLVPGSPAADTSAGRWNSTWLVTLDHPTPSAGYQVRVDLSPAVFHYAGAQAQGGDIRFMDQHQQALDYWIESWDPVQGSVLWVRVPEAGTSSFTMLSGNPAAAPVSSGENTFIFFDDFAGTALDTARWEEKGDGTVTVSNGLTSVGEKALFTKDSIPDIYGSVIDVRGKFRGWTGDDIDIGYGRTTGPRIYVGEAQGDWIMSHGWEGTGMTLRNANDPAFCYQPLYPATPLWDPSGYFTWSLVFGPDSMRVDKDYRSYIRYNTTGCRLNARTLPVEVIFDNSDQAPNYPQYVEWIRVRSYDPSPPRATVHQAGGGALPGPITTATTAAAATIATATTPPAGGTEDGQVPWTGILLVCAGVLVIVAAYLLHARKTGAPVPAPVPRPQPAPRVTPPSLAVTREVRLGGTGTIELELANPGAVMMDGIRITIEPPADILLAETQYQLAGLRPGESRIIAVPFSPATRGTYVLAVQVRYEAGGVPYQTEFPAQVRVV